VDQTEGADSVTTTTSSTFHDQMVTRARQVLTAKTLEVRVRGYDNNPTPDRGVTDADDVDEFDGWRWDELYEEAERCSDVEEDPPGDRVVPSPHPSTPWVPMAGWGIHQVLDITTDGLYDGIEFREAGGEALFLTGMWSDTPVGVPAMLRSGDHVSICPKFHLDGTQVLPIPPQET
jgi:hypothetical protein